MLACIKKLPPSPALRTTRQHATRTAASNIEGLHWYLCAVQGAFHHLVLLDGPAQLAHWILPAGPQPASAAALLAGLWTQADPTLELAVPDATHAVVRGTCRAAGTSRQAFTVAPGNLPTSYLLLHLGAAGLYTLRQLRPGDAGWLLGKVPAPGRPNTANSACQGTACKHVD